MERSDRISSSIVTRSVQFDRQRERKKESGEPEGNNPHHRRPRLPSSTGKNTLESHRRLYQQENNMSSEAETQQPPQPAADVESPSSPADAATAGDKKVIGKPFSETSVLLVWGFVYSKEYIYLIRRRCKV